MDVVQFTQIYNGVKSFKPEITVSEIKEFILNQDKDRQAWLEAAPMMEILDWIVPALSDKKIKKTQNVSVKSRIEAILNDLPVVEEKKSAEFRNLRINRDNQKAMFAGTTKEVIGFVNKMMQETKKYLATIDGITKVRNSFPVVGML